ncbi:para-nitrobenzyl esterase-like [Diabrotica undecimpunctata]|uniref:para-nitrobenzyl esterase-like n=1 Tax=Diabrotica undecimpunctata TaxID=50387 RepID=UPI003B636D36
MLKLKITAICIVLIFFLTFTKVHSNLETKAFLEDDDLVVTLANPIGKIRGHILQSQNEHDIYAFQDVPYAQPPIGQSRFKPPVALNNWDGIVDTTSNTKICPQMPRSTSTIVTGLIETEDCLVLNIYSPVKPGSDSSLPVYFWIHGGSFFEGSGGISQFNPKYFLEQNIVVVTINYRLGALGFLTLNDNNIPGNLGIKDQNLALKWVSENIHLFGGNPNNVVLGGEGSGAISVGYHLLSKSSKGLFSAVIQQSGSSLNIFGNQIGYRDRAFELGRRVNSSFNSNNNTELMEHLQSVPFSDIIRAQAGFRSNEKIGFLKGEYWKPVVEDPNSSDSFVTGPMLEDFENGNFNLVPVLMGYNSEESLTELVATDEEEYESDARKVDQLPSLIANDKLNIPQKNKAKAGKAIKAIYTESKFLENKTAFVRYSSDVAYIHPLLRQAEATAKYTPVYLYKFSYALEDSVIEGTGKVGHGVDLAYFWDSPVVPAPTVDENIRKSLVKFWVNFIKNKNPTPSQDTDLQNIIWPKVDTQGFNFVNIDEIFTIETDPQRQYEEVKEELQQYLLQPFNVY